MLQVKITIYPANTLGSPPEQLEQVKLGAIDMGLPTQGALDGVNSNTVAAKQATPVRLILYRGEVSELMG